MAIQYGSIAIGQAAVGSKGIDPTAPAKLFLEGVESLATASTPEEAASRGSVAAAVLILSSLSFQDPNASLTFGAFLLVLVQNVLSPGSQFLFSKSLFYIYLIKNILIRIITEIQVERKRKKLGLPRVKLKFYIFRKQKKEDFVFKCPRFKKKKIKFLSHNISLPILYEKEFIIKQPVMVKPIRI